MNKEEIIILIQAVVILPFVVFIAWRYYKMFEFKKKCDEKVQPKGKERNETSRPTKDK